MPMEEPSSKVEIISLLLIIFLGGIVLLFAWMVFEGNPTGTKVEVGKCDKIQNPRNQYECYLNNSLITGNAHYCLLVKGASWRNRCLMTVALKTFNSSVCNMIGGEEEFDVSKCIYQLAMTTNNSELCGEIPNAHFKLRCLEKLGGE